jgi:hypothetical protein
VAETAQAAGVEAAMAVAGLVAALAVAGLVAAVEKVVAASAQAMETVEMPVEVK